MKPKAEEDKTSSPIKLGVPKVEADFDAVKMDYENIVLKSEVKAENDGELKPVEQKVANKFMKIKDDSDNKSTFSTSIHVKTDNIPSSPLSSLAEDDDIDVNDLHFNLGNPSINVDDPMNVDHPFHEGGPMEVDQEEQPDIGHPFEAEELETPQATIKKESRDVRSPLDSQPMKQQRLEFDGVLLPSPAEVRRRWALEVHPARVNSVEEIEEMNRKVESSRNPKMKKQEGLVMDPGVTSRRLIAAGIDFLDIDLENDLKDVMVSRKFMAMRFGGSPQETFPSISKANFEKHGFRNFMYCNTDAQSMAPEIPGAGGLFFNPDHMDDFAGVKFKLLTRIQRTPKALWTYVGDYETFDSQSLSKVEWKEQTNRVKRTWANMILKKPWGSSVRVRIFTRKKFNCQSPTREQLERVWEKSEYVGKVTADEIEEAFNRGDEVLHTWAMKCVGFDKSLQRRIIEELKSWVEPESSRKKGTNDKTANKKATKKVVPGSKRKRDEYESEEGEDNGDEDEDEEDDENDEDDHEQVEVDLEVTELSYRARGTRSRPIRI